VANTAFKVFPSGGNAIPFERVANHPSDSDCRGGVSLVYMLGESVYLKEFGEDPVVILPTPFVAGKSAMAVANAQSIQHNFATPFTFASGSVLWDDDKIFSASDHGFVIPASWGGGRARVTAWVAWDNTDLTGYRVLEVLRGNLDTIDFPANTFKPVQNLSTDCQYLQTVESGLVAGEIIGIRGFQSGAGNIDATPRLMIEKLNS
jgi:hypothetical protein